MGRFKVESAVTEAPLRYLVHALGGVGKSTLVASMPAHAFVASEDGLKNIAGARAVQPYPQSWEDILDAVDELATDPTIKTIAIDSLDWAEPLCWEYVVRKANVAKIKAIEDFGYGKGYIAAVDEWRVLIRKLSNAYARGKNIALIAHSIRKPFKDPRRDDYDQWTIKLHEKAAGLFVEWCDVVAFAEQDVSLVETAKDSGRFKGLTTGKRVLRTWPDPSYLAKTRYALPRSIPLDWSSFEAAVKAGGAGAAVRMTKELDAKLEELGDAECEKGCRAFLASRGVSVASLTEAIGTVDSYLAERETRKAS